MAAIQVAAVAADCFGMPGGEAFAEVLQRKLQELQTDGPVLRPPPTHRPAPPLPFLSGPQLFGVGAVPYRSAVYPVCAGSQIRLNAETTATPKPEGDDTRVSGATGTRARRTLTARQHEALERFIWLGANLTPDFSGSELRSTFRALARRYHPDRHPHVTDSERARLARAFAELSDCHRVLVAAVETARH